MIDRVKCLGKVNHNASGKDRAYGSKDILADRQTDRRTKQTHRQTYSSQYFATAPAGEAAKYLLKFKLVLCADHQRLYTVAHMHALDTAVNSKSLKPHLHDTTCRQNGFTTGCIVYTYIQVVVKPV